MEKSENNEDDDDNDNGGEAFALISICFCCSNVFAQAKEVITPCD